MYFFSVVVAAKTNYVRSFFFCLICLWHNLSHQIVMMLHEKRLNNDKKPETCFLKCFRLITFSCQHKHRMRNKQKQDEKKIAKTSSNDKNVINSLTTEQAGRYNIMFMQWNGIVCRWRCMYGKWLIKKIVTREQKIYKKMYKITSQWRQLT